MYQGISSHGPQGGGDMVHRAGLAACLQLLLPKLVHVHCLDFFKQMLGTKSLDPLSGIDQGSPAPWRSIPPHLPG
jgi:hypothetical protein